VLASWQLGHSSLVSGSSGFCLSESAAWTDAGPWQVSHATFACLPSLFNLTTSSWQSEHAPRPAYTGVRDAISANAARPAIYVALHAANSGRGVHVFTPLVDPANLSSRDFLPWETAQAAYLDLSTAVAGSVAAEMESRKLPNTALAAPLRPMNNIAAPAIAVEIASPSETVEDIGSTAYLDQVAQAIAAGIAAMRGKVPEVRP